MWYEKKRRVKPESKDFEFRFRENVEAEDKFDNYWIGVVFNVKELEERSLENECREEKR